jgi:hypothetical protein
MTPQAGCSPKRCFARAGTADSRRRLRGGWFPSRPSVRGFSSFSFHAFRIGAGNWLVVFRLYFQNTFSLRERLCHKLEKAENTPAGFSTLFSHKNAFWTRFKPLAKNRIRNPHVFNSLRTDQKRALYVTESNFETAPFLAFCIAS